jgi:hypothetical protein
VKSINRLAVLSHKRALQAAALIVGAVLLAGCGSPQRLKVHFLPGFVPGSQHIFNPAHIGVYPVQGAIAQGRFRVGAIYAANGTREHLLFVHDFGAAVTGALMKSLADAGLQPALVKSPSPARLPAGVDYLLVTTIEHVSVIKRFGSQVTVHGRYFTMRSQVKLSFVLSSRAAPVLFKGMIDGSEDEPPAPVHHEVFLPLETDPGESLSVAMSRAVGALMVEPGFQQSLPVIERPAPGAATAPTPTPAPGATPNPGPKHM